MLGVVLGLAMGAACWGAVDEQWDIGLKASSDTSGKAYGIGAAYCGTKPGATDGPPADPMPLDRLYEDPRYAVTAEIDCIDLSPSQRWQEDRRAPLVSGEKTWRLLVYAGANFAYGARTIYVSMWNGTGAADASPDGGLRITLYSVQQFGGPRTLVGELDLTQNAFYSPTTGVVGYHILYGVPFMPGVIGDLEHPYRFELVASAGGLTCGIGEAKAHHSGETVLLTDAVVTSTPTDHAGLWLESGDRSAGIRVDASWACNRGDRLDVTGVVSWIDGVPVLTSPDLKDQRTGQPIMPVGGSGKALANDSRECLSYEGLSAVGMLVTTVGRVTYRDSAAGVFYIDDGSALQDGLGPAGPQYTGLRCLCAPGLALPAKETWARVTGIRGVQRALLTRDAWVNGELRHAGETLYVPVMLLRGQPDIAPL